MFIPIQSETNLHLNPEHPEMRTQNVVDATVIKRSALFKKYDEFPINN
jgi:hypothetical protein